MPAFLDYYVTHSIQDGSASMSFTPLKDSTKPEVVKAKIPPPEQVLNLKMETKDSENGESLALISASIVTAFALVAFAYFFYTWSMSSIMELSSFPTSTDPQLSSKAGQVELCPRGSSHVLHFKTVKDR